MRAVLIAVIACLAAAAAGCGNPFVVTDSFTPPPDALSSPPDSLHDYVVGSAVELDVRAARMFIDMNAVKVVSKNPDLLAVDEQSIKDGVIHVKLHAVAAGTASLDFLDDRQRPLEERVIEVKLPDEVSLAVNVDVDKGYTTPAIDIGELLVAAGGSVTFRVTYKKDGKELKGKGVLVGDGGTLTLQNPTREKPDREFFTITAPNEAADKAPVPLKIADNVVTTVNIRVAALSEIATIQLDEGALPGFKNNGDVFTVWGKAFTEGAAPVFGAPFAWTFDSKPVDGAGDLVSYTFQGGERRRIQVSAGDAVNDLTVEAKDGTAVVKDSAAAGCASTPAPLAFALCVLLGVRRGRQFASQTRNPGAAGKASPMPRARARGRAQARPTSRLG